MDDDDTQKQTANEEHPEPIDAFNRALAGVQAERDQLDAAIREHDSEDAEIAAGDAVASWLSACAACRRIASNGRDGRLQVVPARLTLRATHHALLDQFQRAKTQIASPRLHQLLEQYRHSLAIAGGEPLPNDTSVC